MTQNKTCLIVGNGPSLADVSNDTLDRFDTFGCNNCQEKFDPDYYVLVDSMIVDHPTNEFVDRINAMTSQKFIAKGLSPLITGSTPLNTLQGLGFSFEPLKYVYIYFSVTTAMIQLAYYMGYRRIGLVGMDHYWHTPRGKREPHPAEEDVNHYTKAYYTDVMSEWIAPRIDLLDNWHLAAKAVMEARDCQVINLTPGSALKVYPFGNLEDWIE